jgi:hypothetical protein
VERIDAQRLRVSAADNFMNKPCSQLFRDPITHPFHVGDEIALKDATVTVESVTTDGRPQSVVFLFKDALGSSEWTWLAMENGVYVPFDPPAIGSTKKVHGLDLPILMRIITQAFADVFQQ